MQEAIDQLLRWLAILTVPVVFIAALRQEARGKFGPEGVFKLIVLLLFVGALLNAVDFMFDEWPGMLAMLTFDAEGIGAGSELVAMAYGLAAYRLFRALSPRSATMRR
jgi:hypothetical protein